MKKIGILILVLALGCSLCSTVYAEEEDFSIADQIESFMLMNNPYALEKVSAYNNAYLEYRTEEEAIYEARGNPDKITDEMRESIRKDLNMNFALIPENAFCFYPLLTERYAKQYADNMSFDDLIADDKTWVVACEAEQFACHYPEKYLSIDYRDFEEGYQVYDEQTTEFLKDPQAIEEMVEQEIDEEIVDCKIVHVVVATILYLEGVEHDYGIIIYDYKFDDDYPGYLERYKVYTMSEILNSYGLVGQYIHEHYNWDIEDTSYYPILVTKPVYEAEINALMEDGLIAGTDEGAEPLKPLSRIEATAMLVRILGLEDAQTSEVSYFADIASDNWGAKYANIAYDNGIAAGVGDNQFAPNEIITASQFASLLLRSQNQPNDWQTAINTLVERGILTQEEADKMDLFTRGDMAKIIYEAREQGLLLQDGN